MYCFSYLKNFNKLKTPESYIKYGVEGYPFREVIDNIEDEDIIDSMLEMQVDAYNQAIEDLMIYFKPLADNPKPFLEIMTDLKKFKIKQ